MADISPDHELGPQPGNPSTLTGLLSAEYTCPVCNQVVIRIVGNTFQYLPDHFTEQGLEKGNTSFVMYHRDMSKPPNYVPTKIQEKPFLTVRSSTMTS